MQQVNNIEQEAPTIRDLIRGLGGRTNVIPTARKLLAEQGHSYTDSAIYTTVNRNGANNATIAAALLDAIEAEKSTRAGLENRRKALAA